MRMPEPTVTCKALPPAGLGLSGDGTKRAPIVADERGGVRRVVLAAIVTVLMTGIGLALMAAIDRLARFPLTRLSGFF